MNTLRNQIFSFISSCNTNFQTILVITARKADTTMAMIPMIMGTSTVSRIPDPAIFISYHLFSYISKWQLLDESCDHDHGKEDKHDDHG